MMQGGLGLPDRDYYLDQSEKMAAIRTAYVAHLEKMLTLAGQSDAKARAAALMAFETEIAKVHWTQIDSRDADKTYNKMTLAQLEQAAPGFDFASYYAANNLKPASLLVAQPSAITGEAALIAKAPMQVLKDGLLLSSLHAYADYLPDTVADASPSSRNHWARKSAKSTSPNIFRPKPRRRWTTSSRTYLPPWAAASTRCPG